MVISKVAMFYSVDQAVPKLSLSWAIWARLTVKSLPVLHSGHQQKGSLKKRTTSFEATEFSLAKSKTFQSDIYSFVMAMNELLYPDISFQWEKEFSCGSVLTVTSGTMDAISIGKRPYLNERTSYTETKVKCWAHHPEDRPDPSFLRLHLSQLMVINFGHTSLDCCSF